MTANCTPALVTAHDPYCNVDPICWSPNAKAVDADRITGTHQGLAIFPDDPSLVDENPLSWFATDNLWRFTGAVAIVVAICQLIPLPRLLRLLFGVVTLSWCLLELGRWSWSSLEASEQLSFDGGPVSLILPLIYLLPTTLAISGLLVSHRRRAYKRRPKSEDDEDTTT